VLSLCDRLGVPEATDLRATSLTTLVQMAASGLGITILPAMAAGPRLHPSAALRTLRFRGAAPYRTVALAFRPTTARRAELERVAEVLRRRLPEGVEPLAGPAASASPKPGNLPRARTVQSGSGAPPSREPRPEGGRP
jgi:LysR family hydrogen peroxide-inducible transcriptional activator